MDIGVHPACLWGHLRDLLLGQKSDRGKAVLQVFWDTLSLCLSRGLFCRDCHLTGDTEGWAGCCGRGEAPLCRWAAACPSCLRVALGPVHVRSLETGDAPGAAGPARGPACFRLREPGLQPAVLPEGEEVVRGPRGQKRGSCQPRPPSPALSFPRARPTGLSWKNPETVVQPGLPATLGRSLCGRRRGRLGGRAAQLIPEGPAEVAAARVPGVGAHRAPARAGIRLGCPRTLGETVSGFTTWRSSLSPRDLAGGRGGGLW